MLMITTAFRALLTIAVSVLAAPQDTVVLLVDFQHDFVSSDGAWPARPELSDTTMAHAHALVLHAQGQGWPVVRVANAFHPWDPGNLFRKGAAVRGRPGARWVLPDTVHQGPLFSKTRPDAFGSEELEAWFLERSPSVVWVAGYFAEGCMLSTAKSALRRGYTVVTNPSLMASGDSACWRRSWAKMRKAGVVEGVPPTP